MENKEKETRGKKGIKGNMDRLPLRNSNLMQRQVEEERNEKKRKEKKRKEKKRKEKKRKEKKRKEKKRKKREEETERKLELNLSSVRLSAVFLN